MIPPDCRPVGFRPELSFCVIDGKTCYNANMTKLLEEAIERVRQLPEALQDEAAEILLSLASKCTEPVSLDDGTRIAVREGKAQASRGEFVPDEEMAEFFKRHRG
jgi:predicted transcriptional regulator